MKRVFDLAASSLCLVVLSPLFLLLYLMVAVKLGFPVFFFQARPGKNGIPFIIIKFRTMTIKRDKNGDLLPNNQRMTEFGKFLRSNSLDELPELVNVLKGDMSFVGPRPLLMDYIPLFNEFQNKRHDVKPGITGWAQIKGRNALTWEEKFRLDIWYVDNQSVWLDINILWLTLIKVFKKEGIAHEGDVAMPRFTGNKNN
jgi:sugar transferase EpsL